MGKKKAKDNAKGPIIGQKELLKLLEEHTPLLKGCFEPSCIGLLQEHTDQLQAFNDRWIEIDWDWNDFDTAVSLRSLPSLITGPLPSMGYAEVCPDKMPC